MNSRCPRGGPGRHRCRRDAGEAAGKIEELTLHIIKLAKEEEEMKDTKQAEDNAR